MPLVTLPVTLPASSPLLWYLGRGSGLVLLLTLSATTVLGVLATRDASGRAWPGFVTQGVHRSLAGTSVAVLLVHVVSVVADEYVDIRWWQAVLPVGATYRPVWLSLGTLSLDVLVVVAVTSLARRRLPESVWRAVHVTAYVGWAVAVVHGLGTGTDSGRPWSLALTAGCVLAVLVAAGVRLRAPAGPAHRDLAGSRS